MTLRPRHYPPGPMAEKLPIPPFEMRQRVGPRDVTFYENPSGQPIYDYLGVPHDAYESVFDFGCGCGRVARQLMLQTPAPKQYVGVDVNREMLEWCQQNLTPANRDYRFFHHDVYNSSYAKENTLQLAQPFPVPDSNFSLIIAHSVFTHLYRTQTEFYLSEVKRILAPNGVAFLSWFFFDNCGFSFLENGPHTIFVGEADPTVAVIYDRQWFINAVRAVGLRVREVKRLWGPGHQWDVLLDHLKPGDEDNFPLGENMAGWVCGATYAPIAEFSMSSEEHAKSRSPGVVAFSEGWPDKVRQPELFGSFADLAWARKEIELIRHSWTWRIGSAALWPLKKLRSLISR